MLSFVIFTVTVLCVCVILCSCIAYIVMQTTLTMKAKLPDSFENAPSSITSHTETEDRGSKKHNKLKTEEH